MSVVDSRLDEFARIARYFAPLAGPGALGLLDDAALVDTPSGRQLVLTSSRYAVRYPLDPHHVHAPTLLPGPSPLRATA